MTDRLGFYIYPALAILAGCATIANTDAKIYGQPSEPLASGQRYFVTAFDRATTARKCAQIAAEFGSLPIPAHACTYRRPGDTIPTIIISLDDMGLVHKHEVYHVRQLDRGETPDHRGWE
jgi:hypothetical protein